MENGGGRITPPHSFTSKHVSEFAARHPIALRTEEEAAIDNESRELLAVRHTGFIVAEDLVIA